MIYFKDFIREQMENDPLFKEAYEKAKLEQKIALDLIQLRKESGLSQKDLAEKLNTKQSAVSRVENAESKITLSNLVKYAEALGAEVVITFKKREGLTN